MAVSRAVVWGALVVSLLAGEAREADACTPPGRSVYDRHVMPEDGAVAVPRNARILVVYYEHDPGSTLLLQAQGGAPVPVTFSTPRGRGFARMVTPDVDLAASTTYELLDTAVLPCEADEPTSCVGEPVVIATFTTGTELDTTPPNIGTVSTRPGGSCIFPSCPDGQNEAIDGLLVEDVGDDTPDWILYEYLSTDGALLAGPTLSTLTGRGCAGPGYIPFNLFIAMPVEYQIRAVDLAGNVETTPHMIIGRTCEVHDAECNASTDAELGSADDAMDGGCGCASSRGAPGGALLALLALLATARRRTSAESC